MFFLMVVIHGCLFATSREIANGVIKGSCTVAFIAIVLAALSLL